MADTILERIRRLLDEACVPYIQKQHGPTRTSEDSAAARGEPLSVGAKALLIKTDDIFRLFVLPADRKLDSEAIRRELGAKRSRFATPDELLAMTGLVPGSVPPFGEPILPFELYADTAVGQEFGRIAFNAGSLTDSIIMPAEAWESLAKPKRFEFAKTENAPGERGT
jgi:prolyl-tRNA editing enzyme YbaK/EbsC (Cys-tRNA(Pro) deacylase)